MGNALTREMHEEDMDIILSMGTNAIRLAHYQHDQYFYELCDRKAVSYTHLTLPTKLEV